MQKKLHPTELADLARMRQAQSFNVHFLAGMDEKYNEPAATLSEAKAIAQVMNTRHGRFGRRAMIYGLLPDGSAVLMSGAGLESA